MIAKHWYWLGLVACTALMAVAYFYFQKTLGLAPCPLCMFQRVCLVAIGGFCLLGVIFNPQKIVSKIFAFGITLFSMLGFAIAGRQVWLQHLPASQVPECGPDLEFMMEVFPWQDVIRTVLQGSGECADVQWTFLSVSMPEWMVLIFAFMVIVSIKLLFTKQKLYYSSNYRP